MVARLQDEQWNFKLRLTDFSGMLLDNKLKPLPIVGVA